MIRYLALLLTAPFVFGAASVTVNNSGGTVTNYPLQFAQAFVQGEIGTCPQIVYDGTALPTQADRKQTWGDGSAKHVILATLVPSVTAGAHTVTYQAQACSNVPLTQTQMLSAPFNFGATMALTNGSTVTGNARVMLSAWDGSTQGVTSPVNLWTSGQVAQTVIIALHSNTLTCNGHKCSTYDIGFDANKPFRPIFHATFWPGTNQVHVRYIGEISNSETIEDQTYSLALTAGNSSPVTVYSHASFTHSIGTRWTKDFWIGGTPPATITIDPNLTYLRTTKFVPFYDTSTPLNTNTATNVAAQWSNLSAADRDIGGAGNWTQGMGAPGARPDIGPYPSWTVDWLYAATPGLRDAAFGNSYQQMAWPSHYREGATGKVLLRTDTPGSSTGLGKVISISGRPSMCINQQFFNFNATNADLVGTGVGSQTSAVQLNAGNWVIEGAHIPEGPVVQYITTGEFLWLEEQMFWASLYTAEGYAPTIYYRGPTGAEGSLFHDQTRAQAWNLRTWVNTAWVIPDAMPEKQYFTQLLVDAIALEEGMRNITTTAYNGNTMWLQGRNVWAKADANTSFGPNGTVTILHQWNGGDPGTAQNEYGICSTAGAGTPCVPPTVSSATGLFEIDYMNFALGRCTELGFKCDALLTWSAFLPIGMLTNPGAFNPYILDNGRVPTYDTSSPPAQFTSFAQLNTGYNATWRGFSGYSTASDPDGYLAYSTAAMSYMCGQPNGAAACSFLQAHGMSQTVFAIDPKWHLIPSSAAPVTCGISGTLPGGTVGISYGTPLLTATNCGVGTLTWTITSGALPPGLTGCNGTNGTTCSVSGTPTTTTGSPFALTIRVSDGGTNTASANFSITIASNATAPVITSTSPLPNGTVGTSYSFQFAASGTAPITWSVFSGGATCGQGLTLSSTGLLSGAPTTVESCSFSVQALNSAGAVNSPFSLTISSASSPPTITSTSPLPAGAVGIAYSFTFAATGTSPISWSATNIPSGLALNASTGVLSGTPGGATTVSMSVTATNALGNALRVFSLTINTTPIPTITSSSPLPFGTVGVAYSFQFAATGSLPITWGATGLPSWASLSSTGLLTGVPNATGSTTISVTATNTSGTSGPQSFTLPVLALPDISTTSPITSGTVNVPYTFTFTASGSTPITWAGTNLPSWATLHSATGVLDGTPTAAGTTVLTITPTNAAGSGPSKNLNLTIAPQASLPTITSTSPITTGVVGSAYSYQFTGTGAPLSWSATGLPAWASMSASGLVTGTPTAAGSFTLAVTVTNTAGSAGPTSFTLPVIIAPTITSTSPVPAGTNGTAYSFQFVASGSTPITWGATGLPGWASLSSGGLLTGTPNVNTTTVFAVTATNAAGNSGPHNFSITVNAAPTAPTITSISPIPQGILGVAYSYQFLGTGTAPVTWSATGLPGWASLATNGLLTGTPNSNVTTVFNVTATNGTGSAGPTPFSISVIQVIPGNVRFTGPVTFSGGVVQ